MSRVLQKIIPKLVGFLYNITSFFSSKLAARWALSSFCRVRNRGLNPKQESFLSDAEQLTRAIADHSIREYRWAGTGETVLLVHGWTSNAARWRNLIRPLVTHNYNVIAFDAPGHGNSSGKFLNVILYAECLENLLQIHQPTHIIGHSVGGMTVLYNEYKNPSDFVRQIVTTAAPSEFYEVMDEYQALLGLNGRMMRALDELVLEIFGFRIREFSTSRFAATNMKKGLLIHDTLDSVTPYHASQKVHKAWKNSRLMSTNGYGHSLHQEEVNKAILEFLNTGQ